ncbi:MAG: hypothetical protein EOP46_00405 [Sphingobacteriaceae bacterium]|nr:MAG: hypothetical protein EOP46_00405 [Sphingobacteriaceae bacterium]
MEKIIEKHDRIKQLIAEINNLTTRLTANEIIFFNGITIHVGYESEDGCFKDIVNWLYALFIEVCGPNVKFFEEKFGLYGLNLPPEALNIPKDIHIIRTVSSHNLDYGNTANKKKKNYYENWFYKIIKKSQAETKGDYGLCLLYLLSNVIVYLETLKLCIDAVGRDEHFNDIILIEWKRRNDRNYGIYDFEVVLVQRLEQFGIDTFLDANKIAKREIDKWRGELKLLKDGFDFATEAGRIIDKYIIEKKYCPIDPKDLLDIGADKEDILRIYNEVLGDFNRQPRHKDELLHWVIDQSLILKK